MEENLLTDKGFRNLISTIQTAMSWTNFKPMQPKQT